MMKKIAIIFSLSLLALPVAASEESVSSPDGRLVVTVSDEGGKPTYSVKYDGIPFLWRSPLGLKTDFGDFTQGYGSPAGSRKGRLPMTTASRPSRSRPCTTRPTGPCSTLPRTGSN